MADTRPRISRWVLVLEMIGCFIPLTLLFLAVLVNLGRLDMRTAVVSLTVTCSGPIGLLVAFKILVLNRPTMTGFWMSMLGVLAAWTGLAYALHIIAEGEPTQWWREFVLIAFLPVLGIFHLLYLAERRTAKPSAI